MPKAPQIEEQALWKKRYRTDVLWDAALAHSAPTQGMVSSSTSCATQLHAWNVFSGTLRQLTHSEAGVLEGTMSPDGRFVYYLRDEGGSERGIICVFPGMEERNRISRPTCQPMPLSIVAR